MVIKTNTPIELTPEELGRALIFFDSASNDPLGMWEIWKKTEDENSFRRVISLNSFRDVVEEFDYMVRKLAGVKPEGNACEAFHYVPRGKKGHIWIELGGNPEGEEESYDF